ncbi:DEAD/DEAH box helicase, partial [Jatrophihabitans sp. YIM 134969]
MSTPTRARRPARSSQNHGGQNQQNPSRGRGRGGSQPQRPAKRSPLDDLEITPIATENLPSFGELGLPAPVATALQRRGIDTPFPVQAATIPAALAGRDVIGRAATGAGKTLAFGLPMLARLHGGRRTTLRPRGLVLVPTRELAMQVTDSLSPVADSLDLRVKLVAGGLPMGKQIQALRAGVDVLVATPGRLEDLISQRAADLGGVEVVVIDEADHMADLGFLPVVKRILDQTPADGQRLLFSATLDGDVAVLVDRYLHDPAAFALAATTQGVTTMSHHVWRTTHEEKPDLAASIGAREGRTIMFVRTKHGADRLAKKLGRVGVPAGVLHGGRSQPQRTRALDAFKDGSVPLLIATDVAARGIHVDDVSLVVHVDPPTTAKDYVHRSGRTARAGNDGVVVALTTPADAHDMHVLLREAGVRSEAATVSVGDEHVRAVTGAKTPSGKPIAPVNSPTAPNPYRERARAAAAAGAPRASRT